MLTKAALEKLAPWLQRMADKPLKLPDSSLDISIRSFEELKPRSDKVTWVLGTEFEAKKVVQAATGVTKVNTDDLLTKFGFKIKL